MDSPRSNNPSRWRLLILALLYLFTNLIENVAVQMMGYYMPIYSTFLLYGTTAIYILLFATMAFLNGEYTAENWRILKENCRLVWLLGFFTAFNGIFAQISIPFVSPELTSLITQISTPVTWIAAPFILCDPHSRPTFLRCVSFVVILFGLLFGGLYSMAHGSGADSTYKNGWWIAVALLSALPTSFETIYQQIAYKERRMPIYLTLTLYNIISFIPYFVWMFTTMTKPFGTCVHGDPHFTQCAVATEACSAGAMFEQQVDAVRCTFGDYSVQCCGKSLSTAWVILFTIFYCAAFAIASYILKADGGSNVLANLNALTSPFVGMFFWVPGISGPSRSTPKWWIAVSFVVILAGNLIYDNLGGLDRNWNRPFGPDKHARKEYAAINDDAHEQIDGELSKAVSLTKV